VDETKGGAAVVKAQEAVAAVEAIGECLNTVHEVALAFTIVVEMDLDIGDAGFAHFGERIEELWAILLLGIKEGVARRAADGVMMAGGDFRPAHGPKAHAGAGLLRGGAGPTGLEMVGEENPGTLKG
jgi:hypothetical protein